MLSEEQISRILSKLDNWVIDDEQDPDIMDSLSYNKKVTSEELNFFFKQGLYEAISYCCYEPDDDFDVTWNDTWEEAVYIWTAGLLWKKYDIRANSQIDETNTLGFGDILINNAKTILKPFRMSTIAMW